MCMTYVLIAAANMVSLGAFVWLVLAILDSHAVDLANLRKDHRRDLVDLMERLDAKDRSHREEMAAFHQARVEEVQNMAQRIQAPKEAAVSHQAAQAPPDPPPVNLEDDNDMFEAYRERLESLGVVNG